MYSPSSNYFHVTHTISSLANRRLVKSVPVVARNRKSSCRSEITFDFDLLVDSVSLHQNEVNELRKSFSCLL